MEPVYTTDYASASESSSPSNKFHFPMMSQRLVHEDTELEDNVKVPSKTAREHYGKNYIFTEV